MTPDARLADLEARYLDAREAHDRLDVARATGVPAEADAVAALESAAEGASRSVHERLASFTADDEAVLGPDDRRALAAMRAGIAVAEAFEAPVGPPLESGPCDDEAAWRDAIRAGGEDLHRRLEACYSQTALALDVGGGATLTRLQVLDRLGTEPDADRRRALFLAIGPLWRVVNGDDGDGSPYRAYVAGAGDAWRAARATSDVLGVAGDETERWSTATLEAWRAAVVEPARTRGEPPVEPWDWWWRAGATSRALGVVPLAEAREVNREVYASLGADVEALNIRFDITDRPGRPPVPVAFTTFGGRPHRRTDGSWSPGEPVILESIGGGGFLDLAELLHETGHGIHIAGIRTRPAFAEWPDSDGFTEALAELVAYDAADPAWQARRLPGRATVTEAESIRAWYASVVLDAAWALFEVRMLTDPTRRPNEVWTEITSTWLGIAPHPEWSWWAMRGQLVQEAGYMGHYAVGAVVATALRRAIREARGDWLDGDPGWYAWVRDRVYRFGLERPARDVVTDVTGGRVTPEALVAEIARAAG